MAKAWAGYVQEFFYLTRDIVIKPLAAAEHLTQLKANMFPIAHCTAPKQAKNARNVDSEGKTSCQYEKSSRNNRGGRRRYSGGSTSGIQERKT